MKVLIVGEFSAFAKNLSVGINSIDGNEAVVFANDDGFKKIKQTSLSYTYKSPHNIKLFGFEIRGTHKIVGYFQYMKFKKDLKKFKNYFDVIFIISYTLIREEHNKTNPQFSINDLKYAIKKDGKIFMSSCGGDVAFFEFAKQNKRFSCVYKDLNIPRMPLYYKQKDLIKDIVKGVIPMSYQYHEAYRLYGKEFPLLNPIQLPFDVSTVPHKSEYLKNKKITIFNGALRPTKGTKFIVEALQKISEKYSDRIIIREDRLPYNQFLNFLTEIDIYIDLCTDYDYGMSAIAAMLAGCVVLSGNEPETRLTIGTNEIPVVSACPDSNQLYTELEKLILHPEEIERIGKQSVVYARQYHDCKFVAQRYLDVFQNN